MARALFKIILSGVISSISPQLKDLHQQLEVLQFEIAGHLCVLHR